MNRREFLVSSVAAGALALGAPTAFAQDKLTILGSVPSLSFPFFVHMLNQIKVEAEAQGVNLTESDGQNSAPKQTADIEAAIVQKVNAIVISPLDVNALAPAIEQAVQAGVPVVTIDRRVDGVEIRARELHGRGARVLLDVLELAGAGDRYDPRLAREQPSEAQLRKRDL